MRGAMHLQQVCVAALATIAHTQVEQVDWWQAPLWAHPWQAGAWQGTPLDQGLEDVGPIGTSLRRTTRDLHAPRGFDEVFRTDDGLLMRRDGALEAIFPRSSYIATPDGVAPAIPAGTIFRIDSGDRDWSRIEPQAQGGIDLRVDLRAKAKRAPLQGVPRARGTIYETIWSSEAYRRRRVAELLARAAASSAR